MTSRRTHISLDDLEHVSGGIGRSLLEAQFERHGPVGGGLVLPAGIGAASPAHGLLQPQGIATGLQELLAPPTQIAPRPPVAAPRPAAAAPQQANPFLPVANQLMQQFGKMLGGGGAPGGAQGGAPGGAPGAQGEGAEGGDDLGGFGGDDFGGFDGGDFGGFE